MTFVPTKPDQEAQGSLVLSKCSLFVFFFNSHYQLLLFNMKPVLLKLVGSVVCRNSKVLNRKAWPLEMGRDLEGIQLTVRMPRARPLIALSFHPFICKMGTIKLHNSFMCFKLHALQKLAYFPYRHMYFPQSNIVSNNKKELP